MTNITTVTLREQQVSPKKARLVMNLIRNKKADQALSILDNLNKKTASYALALLKSGIDAAKAKDFKTEDLFVSESLVQEGRKMKRIFIRARGRSSRYMKRSSHLKLSLAKIDDKAPEVKKAKKSEKVEKNG